MAKTHSFVVTGPLCGAWRLQGAFHLRRQIDIRCGTEWCPEMREQSLTLPEREGNPQWRILRAGQQAAID